LLILYYNNRLSKASKGFISTIKLLIFTTTFCRKIQKKQKKTKKNNKLIVFFAISLISINFIISRFRKKNLKNLIANKE